MKSVLFSKIVNMDALCEDFLGQSLSSLIGVSESGTEIQVSVNSQVLFRHGLYYYGYPEHDYDEFAETSINCFFKLIDYLEIERGNYSENVRLEIAKKCEELLPVSESPYDYDMVIVDDYVYVDQQEVLRFVDEEVKKKDILIKATPLSEDWLLEEVLMHE